MVRSARSRMMSLVVAIVLIVSAIFVFGQIGFSAASTGDSARVAVATHEAAALAGESSTPAARVTVSAGTPGTRSTKFETSQLRLRA